MHDNNWWNDNAQADGADWPEFEQFLDELLAEAEHERGRGASRRDITEVLGDKRPQTFRELLQEQAVVAAVLGSRTPWKSGKPRRLTPAERLLVVRVSPDVAPEERLEAEELLAARTGQRNTRNRNLRSRRAA